MANEVDELHGLVKSNDEHQMHDMHDSCYMFVLPSTINQFHENMEIGAAVAISICRNHMDPMHAWQVIWQCLI